MGVPLYFDHASILKTIARTFLSASPPFLAPRYAAARDVSEVIGSKMRRTDFRPYIPYNFVYAESKLRLDVEHGSLHSGTPLCQNQPDVNAKSQEFRLDDAADGYWFIRTHAGNMYVTADQTFGVKQDFNYGESSAGAGQDPNTQKWKLMAHASPVQGVQFSIANAAFPTKLLQPAANSSSAQAAMVLGDPENVVGALRAKNPWTITSPRLGCGVAHPSCKLFGTRPAPT